MGTAGDRLCVQRIYPLVMTDIAWHDIEIGSFPIRHGESFHNYNYVSLPMGKTVRVEKLEPLKAWVRPAQCLPQSSAS